MIASVLPLVPLDALQAGECGVIVEMDGPAAAMHRLHELGIRVGEPLRMLRQGPPHLVQIGESRLALRADADVTVLVGLQG